MLRAEKRCHHCYQHHRPNPKLNNLHNIVLKMSPDTIYPINYREYYETYHGHTVPLLKKVEKHLRHSSGKKSLVYLAGDSSLDSKFWFQTTKPAVNGYEALLPKMKADICYHLNKLFAEHGLEYAAINTAVEESTLEERMNTNMKGQNYGLKSQDVFIRDSIRPNDVLFVSVGGNDIALKPSMKTIFNMGLLLLLEDEKSLAKDPSAIWGMSHFIYLFKDQMTKYLQMLTAKTKPKRIIVSAIYYPDETPSGGWADNVLGKMSYFDNPKKLQAAIRAIFTHAISQIKITGTEVVPFAMYEVMNCKNSKLYCAGVEPSALGNKALAHRAISLIVVEPKGS